MRKSGSAGWRPLRSSRCSQAPPEGQAHEQGLSRCTGMPDCRLGMPRQTRCGSRAAPSGRDAGSAIRPRGPRLLRRRAGRLQRVPSRGCWESAGCTWKDDPKRPGTAQGQGQTSRKERQKWCVSNLSPTVSSPCRFTGGNDPAGLNTEAPLIRGPHKGRARSGRPRGCAPDDGLRTEYTQKCPRVAAHWLGQRQIRLVARGITD